MSNVYLGSQEIVENYLGSLSSSNPNFQQIPQNPLIYLNAQIDFSGGTTSGSVWTDLSSNDNDFTISGTKYTSTYPKYIYDGYAIGPLPSDSSVVGLDSDDFTIGSWFQSKAEVTGSTSRFLFSRGWDRGQTLTDNFFEWGLLTNIQNSKIVAAVTYTSPSLGTQEVASSNNISKDTWYHCVINYKQGDFLKLYINGVERGSLNLTGTSGLRSVVTSSWSIGRWQNPQAYTYTNQWVSQFGVYNRSLSSTDISNWYNATKEDYGY